jgi:hypothetical protein
MRVPSRPDAPSPPARNREAVLAAIALLLVGVVAYASHIRHGGFYLDDWSNAAGTLHPPGGPGFGNAVSYFSEITLYRPVLVVYVPLTYLVSGTHMAYQLAWAVLLAVFIATMLFLILRALAVPRLHAWLIAVLTLVYPWFDSTRLWESAGQASFAIALYLTGLWLALAALRRRSLRLHAAAAALYLLSILTYEVTLPLVVAAVLLYMLRAGWRAARKCWAIDVAAAVAGGLWVGLETTREKRGVSADISHLKMIVTSGGTIIGRTLLPVGPQKTALALVLLVAVAATGVAAWLWTRRTGRSGSGWGLGSWLAMSGGGLLVAALGWLMFIPANPYYTPSVYGFTNRVNSLAGFGLVIAAYGALGVVGALIGQLRPHARMLPAATTVALGLGLGFAYTHVLERHSRIWNAAYRAESAAIGVMRMQLPHLPPGSTVFTSNYPDYQTLGVPIFSASWDLNGMIKLQYKDGSLSAYPVLPELSLSCSARGVGVRGTGAPQALAPYGSAVLLDLRSGRHDRPQNERQCRALAGTYTPGPLYLSLTY